MNSSNNPFLANDTLNQSFNVGTGEPLDSLPPLQPMPSFSTPRHPAPTLNVAAEARATDSFNPTTPMQFQTPFPVTSSLPMPAVYHVHSHQPTMRLSEKKFSGYMHEDASKFLSEFESYLLLSGVDPNQDSPRAIAAFHLHLTGPALTWFNTLHMKTVWQDVRREFCAEYGDNCNNPRLIAEAAAFDNLALLPHQAIEEFHSIVLEKGTRLGKNQRDMTNKFLNGLPKQLAFFVRAGKVDTFREALHSAKIGEAHGYRQHEPLPTVHVDTSLPVVNAALTKPPQQLPPRQRTCYACRSTSHLRAKCNWTGEGSPFPGKTCQLCMQQGHVAVNCKLRTTATTEPCQLCDQTDHTARKCPTLNGKSLRTVPTSQA